MVQVQYGICEIGKLTDIDPVDPVPEYSGFTAIKCNYFCCTSGSMTSYNSQELDYKVCVYQSTTFQLT